MNVSIVFNSKYSKSKPSVSQTIGGMHNRPLSVYRFSGAIKKAKGTQPLLPSPPIVKSLENLALKCKRLNMFLNLPVSIVEDE